MNRNILPFRLLEGLLELWRSIFFGKTFTLVLASLVVFLSGCADEEVATNESAESDLIELKPIVVGFVGEQGASDAVARQWKASMGSEIKCVNVPFDEFENNPVFEADVLIYPPRHLGHLVADDRITEIPDEVWDSEELVNQGFLRDCRVSLNMFGGRRWAISLGSPNLMLMIRSDVLKQLDLEPPETWDGLVELCNQLNLVRGLKNSDGESIPNAVGVLNGEHQIARLFLAMVASSVRHRGKLNYLFDRSSMEPLTSTPPFKRALMRLKSIASNSEGFKHDDLISNFLTGKLAIAIGWPSRALDIDLEKIDELTNEYAVISRMPGSRDWYSFSEQKWFENENAEVSKVDLIGFAGLQASLLKTAKYPTSAFRFLSWLGKKKTAATLFSNCSTAGPSRISHLGDPSLWIGSEFNLEASDQYAEVVLSINESPIFMVFPRIRGADEYMSVLEAHVKKFLVGELNEDQVLESLKREFETITERYGREAQKELLRKDFGV